MKRLAGLIGLVAMVASCTTAWAGMSVERVTDIVAGAGNSYPTLLTEYNNKLYFVAGSNPYFGQLWCYDGQNTTLASDIYVSKSEFDTQLIEYNGSLYFGGSQTLGNDIELWAFDGQNTEFVADIFPTSESSLPKDFVDYNNELYFSATDSFDNGWELWKYDGNHASMVADINANDSSLARHLTVVHGELVFAAEDDYTDPLQGHGKELWNFNGTEVSMVADINPGWRSSDPERFTVFQDDLYFYGKDGQYNRFFRYDGEVVEALPLSLNNAYLHSPLITVCNGHMYYEGYDGGLWRYDGSAAEKVADFDRVAHMIDYIGNLYFVAKEENSIIGEELWRFDGETIELVADINPGLGGSNASGFAVIQNELFFTAKTEEYGQELYRLIPEPTTLIAFIGWGAVMLQRRHR